MKCVVFAAAAATVVVAVWCERVNIHGALKTNNNRKTKSARSPIDTYTHTGRQASQAHYNLCELNFRIAHP